MKLTIESLRGVWRFELNGRTEIADTLEEGLNKLAPDAPAAYIYHAGELLGGILGAEVVEVEQDDNWGVVAEWLDALEITPEDIESWQPTEAQRAYFNPEVEGDGA